MLPFEKKYEIIQLLERGESKNDVARKYDIPWSIAHSLYVHRKQIKKYFDFNKKIMKHLPLVRMLDLETAVWQWCNRCMEKNIELSGIDIRKKALEFNEILNLDPNFKASYQWLRKFKDRYNIPHMNIMKYVMATNKNALHNFRICFKKFLRENKVTLQNVYSVNYTEILWKAVPEETSIFDRAKWTGDQDMCEDHVITLFCANATGCHKLPVLIIGSIAEPQGSSILNTDGISTTYKVKANAWMDNIIFNQWFEEYFLKLVKERQEKNGRRQKTVLILDNNRLVHNLSDLSKKDKFVRVVSIPRDVSIDALPINNEVIACFKRMYRRELVVTLMLLPVWNTEEEVIQAHKKLTLWDSCRMIHDAWSHVDNEILLRGWNIFFGYNNNYNKFVHMLTRDVEEITAYMRTLPGCERINGSCVLKWFKVENVRDIAMKISTNEVLESFGNTDIVYDEAESSLSKIPKVE